MRITLFQPGKNKNPPKTKTKPKEGLTTGRRSPPLHPPPNLQEAGGGSVLGGAQRRPRATPPPGPPWPARPGGGARTTTPGRARRRRRRGPGRAGRVTSPAAPARPFSGEAEAGCLLPGGRRPLLFSPPLPFPSPPPLWVSLPSLPLLLLPRSPFPVPLPRPSPQRGAHEPPGGGLTPPGTAAR